MPCEITVEASDPRDADTVFAEALQLGELRDAMRGLATYDDLPEGAAEEGVTSVVDVTLFGIQKKPGHTMHVEKLDRAERILQSREQDPSVTRWDHTLSVQPEAGGCLWTDRVIIDAPKLAWATARFAASVYARRHRHRRALSVAKVVRGI